MTHEEIRERLNQELGGTKAFSLAPGEGTRVTSGLSSGSMRLNMALSGGPLVGYAWGRIVEIYGPESGGKTTLALHAIYEAQRLEQASGEAVPCLFVDAEHALDATYAQSIGINMDELDIVQPDFGEEGLEAVERAVEVGYKLIVVDSVAALTPRAEVEGEMGDSHMGLHARLMSQAMRKLAGKCSKSDAIIIFINQTRMKIGIVFGNPETTTGGNALKFYCTYRIVVRSPKKGIKTGGSHSLADMGDTVAKGTVVNATVSKNKVFPPHRKASFYIEYGKGIDRHKDAIDFLVLAGAFKETTIRGKKQQTLGISSKGKRYTASGVLKLFRDDQDVQRDVLAIVRKIDEEL